MWTVAGFDPYGRNHLSRSHPSPLAGRAIELDEVAFVGLDDFCVVDAVATAELPAKVVDDAGANPFHCSVVEFFDFDPRGWGARHILPLYWRNIAGLRCSR